MDRFQNSVVEPQQQGLHAISPSERTDFGGWWWRDAAAPASRAREQDSEQKNTRAALHDTGSVADANACSNYGSQYGTTWFVYSTRSIEGSGIHDAVVQDTLVGAGLAVY
jgi:hypothetical protein